MHYRRCSRQQDDDDNVSSSFERNKSISNSDPNLGGSESTAAVAAAFLPTVLIDGMPATLVALELGVVADVSVAADSGLVIELLTKAYEQFKQSRQLRMILFLAAQVRAAEDR